MEEIGKSLPAVFKRHVRTTNPPVVEILAPLWTRVVGKGVAEHSRPAEFWFGKLTLATSCATWAAQMRQLEPEILSAVNAFLGGAIVKRLEVRLVAAASRRSSVRAQEELREPVVADDGKRLNDDDPAAVVERSFQKYFARGAKETR